MTPDQGEGIVQGGGQVEPSKLQFEPAGLHLGQVEDVIDPERIYRPKAVRECPWLKHSWCCLLLLLTRGLNLRSRSGQ